MRMLGRPRVKGSPRFERLRDLPHDIQNEPHGLQPTFGTQSYSLSFSPS